MPAVSGNLRGSCTLASGRALRNPMARFIAALVAFALAALVAGWLWPAWSGLCTALIIGYAAILGITAIIGLLAS